MTKNLSEKGEKSSENTRKKQKIANMAKNKLEKWRIFFLKKTLTNPFGHLRRRNVGFTTINFEWNFVPHFTGMYKRIRIQIQQFRCFYENVNGIGPLSNAINIRSFRKVLLIFSIDLLVFKFDVCHRVVRSVISHSVYGFLSQTWTADRRSHTFFSYLDWIFNLVCL